MVALFGFGWRDVADGPEQSSVVEPVDPFAGGELDGLEISPWPSTMDNFGLVEPVDGLGEGIVVAVSDAPHGRLYAGLGQPLGVADRDVLHASVTGGRGRRLWSAGAGIAPVRGRPGRNRRGRCG